MRGMLGSRAHAFFASYDAMPEKALHLNTLKCGGGVVEKLGLSPLFDFPSNGFKVTQQGLGRHPYHAAGLYYMQEPSAMLPALAVDIPQGASVLDMCAAPGGKTSQLACALGGEGLIVANEYDRARAATLKENVTRMGYTNVAVVNMFAGRIATALPGYFDVAVVDAPCSGEGMFRKNPDAAREWSEAHVAACARRQKEIAASAAACLKTGGLMIYSTCTFAPEEDEEVVKEILSLGFELVPAKKAIAALGVDTGFGIKYYPHLFGEGQFAAVLQKTGGAQAAGIKTGHKPAPRETLRRLSDIIDINGLDIAENNGIVYTALPLPAPFDFAVKLGTVEKDGRITPAHSLFAAYGDRCRKIADVDITAAERYMKGEELDTKTANGWGCLKVDGYALGGYKSAGGKLKNHYPKALRYYS